MYAQLYQKILPSFLLSMASSIVPIEIGSIILNQAEQATLSLQQTATKNQTMTSPVNAKHSFVMVYPELELTSDRKDVMASTIDVDLEHPSQQRVRTDRITILEKLILEFLKNPAPHARLWARLIILIANRKDNQLQLDQQMLSKILCVLSR